MIKSFSKILLQFLIIFKNLFVYWKLFRNLFKLKKDKMQSSTVCKTSAKDTRPTNAFIKITTFLFNHREEKRKWYF